MRVKRKPVTTAHGSTPTHDVHDPPKPPNFSAGGWRDIMRDTYGGHVVTLDNGAFLWLWDCVENLSRNAEQKVRSMDPEFRELYVDMSLRARDAFRDCVAGDETMKYAWGQKAREAEAAKEQAEIDALILKAKRNQPVKQDAEPKTSPRRIKVKRTKK